MSSLGILGLELGNNIVMFGISTLEFRKIEFLTHIVNFGIGFAFSQDPGAGPGLL